MTKKPHEYAPLGKNHAYLGRFRNPKFLAQGHNFSGKLVETAQKIADDIFVPALDRVDQDAMTAAQREAARKSDPEFRKHDDAWQEKVRTYRRRKAQGEGDR